MNFRELYREVSKETKLTFGDSKEVCQAVFDVIKRELAVGNDVRIHDFGSFSVKTRPSRIGFNPKTREELEIPEKKSPVFKSAKALKDIVND